MPGTEKLIFVSSSMDLDDERRTVMDAVRDLSREARTSDVFEPLLWERASEDGTLAFQSGSSYQRQITPLIEQAAIVVVLFGERLGLPLYDQDAIPIGFKLEPPVVFGTSTIGPGEVPLTGTVCEFLYARDLQRRREGQGRMPEPAVLAFLKAPRDVLREDDPATAGYGFATHFERLLEDARRRTGKSLRALPTAEADDYSRQLRWLHDFVRSQFVQSPVTFFEKPEELRRLVRTQLQRLLGLDTIRTGNPFKGLASYGIDDADDFKGRKEEVARILEAIEARAKGCAMPLVLVSGCSGSGKSSLVQAGLAVALQRGQRGSLGRFDSVISTPAQLSVQGKAPLEELADRIEDGWGCVFSPDLPRSLWQRLAPVDRVDRLAGMIANRARQTGSRLFLALDQAEEMSRDWHAGDSGSPWRELAAFLSVHTASGAGLSLIAFNDAHSKPLLERLALARNGGPTLSIKVRPPSDMQLDEIITVPFKERGLQLDAELVDCIKSQIASVPEGDESPMPLLSMTLYRLYASWERSAKKTQVDGGAFGSSATDVTGRTLLLDLARYKDAVDLENVIVTLAEEAFEALGASRRIDWRLDGLFTKLFRRLVHMGSTGESLRDADYPRDDPALGEMVDKLLDCRLLRHADQGRIRIAHEAVLRRWPHAKQWLDEEREQLKLLERLDPRARVWNQDRSDPSSLLDRKTPERAADYDKAEELFGKWASDLDPTMRIYLEQTLMRGFSKDIERIDDGDGTPRLYWAAAGGSLPLIRRYLELGADPNLCSGSKRRFPLFGACFQSDPALVGTLLDKGADPNAALANGTTPLMLASWRGETDIVALLLERGAHIEASDLDDYTALAFAASVGHERTVALLATRGADVAKPYKDGPTALILAARNGRDAVVRYLLAPDHHPDAHRMPTGETALMLAAQHAPASTVGLLLKAHADVDARTKDGVTPLMLAAQSGREANVRALLEKIPQLDAQDDKGWTAMMHAAFKGHASAVAALLHAGAAVVPRAKDGRTVMNFALSPDAPEVLDTLLSLGDPQGLLDACLAPPVAGHSVPELLEMDGRARVANLVVASFPPGCVPSGSGEPTVVATERHGRWPALQRHASWEWIDVEDVDTVARDLVRFHSTRALRDPAELGQVVAARRASLACFDGIDLVECLLYSSDGTPARVIAALRTLTDGRCVAVIDGQSLVWHEMARRRLLVAESTEAAADLLRAFDHYVTAEKGAFTLIERASQIPWLSAAPEPLRQKVDSLIGPLSIAQEDDRFVASGRVLYGDALYAASFEMKGSRIAMLDDDPLVGELPVAADQWRGRFRIFEGSVDRQVGPT